MQQKEGERGSMAFELVEGAPSEGEATSDFFECLQQREGHTDHNTGHSMNVYTDLHTLSIASLCSSNVQFNSSIKISC